MNSIQTKFRYAHRNQTGASELHSIGLFNSTFVIRAVLNSSNRFQEVNSFVHRPAIFVTPSGVMTVLDTRG